MTDRQALSAIDRLYRRVMLMVGRGRVTQGDDSGSIQLLQVQLSGSEVRDDTPRLAEFGLSSMPPVGSDVIVVFGSGDRSNAVVIATGNQASRPTGLLPGEVIVYDGFGKSIKFSQSDGIIIDGNGQNLTINNCPTLTQNGNLQVNGGINGTGGMAIEGSITATVEVSAGSHTLTAHKHGNVSNGSGVTNPPIG